jgi:Tol biopolymer transport system component
VILIFALVGGAGLLIRSTQMNQAQHLSATPTIIPIPTCTLVNTADSSVQPESTLDSLTPDSTLVGDSYGQLVFQSDMDGNSEIYLVDVDGTNLANLTQNPAADSVPAWSPDGSQIAFASNRDRTNENLPDRIFMMNADGSGQHSITGDINVFSPLSWSHITNLIAFVRLEENFNVYVINDDGSNTQQLTQNEFLSTNNLFGYISIVTWSPDGSQIAFSASRSIDNDQIYVMNADGSGLCHLKPDSEFASLGAPAWSPDGNRVAFVSGRDGKNDIYVMDVDGTNSQNLTQNSAGDSFFPAWSPNGSQIAFSTDRDGEHLNIYVMNANGSNVRRVTNNQSDNRYPSWRPLPLSS